MISHIRFHGRGGEGVKLASHIVSRAAFLSGCTVQDSPLYGAERRGAPVVAFARLSHGPIHERGYIDVPDAVALMDVSLLTHPEAGVLAGLDATSLVLVNSSHSAEELRARFAIPGRVATLDVTALALELLGQPVLSAPVAGFVTKAAGIAGWDRLAEAVRCELAAIGLADALIERNLEATRRAFAQARTLGLAAGDRASTAIDTAPFTVPTLSACLAAPSILAEANAALRTMEGWRVYRPVIDLPRCTRCFICFALCPEGAIHLDPDHYPVVDYDHCKGCLICATECPPHAIEQRREEAL